MTRCLQTAEKETDIASPKSLEASSRRVPKAGLYFVLDIHVKDADQIHGDSVITNALNTY